MDLTKDEHKILRKSQKKCDRDPDNYQTSIQGRKHEPYTESQNSFRLKKARQVKSKVKSMLIILFNNGIVLKEFVLASQTVDSAYYCVLR
jgi:hypothetical protein